MPDKVPARIYRCPVCGYDCDRRYVLRNHLMAVHGMRKKESAQVALENEYWLNPHYVRRSDLEEEDEDI